MPSPNVAEFQATFVTNIMAVPSTAIPSSDVIGYAYNGAMNRVNPKLACVPNFGTGWSVYTDAVYNLAAHILTLIATDANGAPVYQDDMPYWQYIQQTAGVNNFVPGVVSSTSDSTTSVSFAVAQAFQNLTIQDLACLKTRWGLAYLGIAQGAGYDWGRN